MQRILPSSLLPSSLRGLLLLNESTFLALVLVTATLSGLWAWFWTESSREATRIETVARLAERVRGDTYRQLHEATHARLTEDPAALNVYSGYRSQIAGRFDRLRTLVRDENERAAVDYLHDAYAVVLDDMEKVFTDPNEITEAARMKLLDPAYEEWMLSELESAMKVIDGIVERRREGLEAWRSAWTRWTPVVVPVSVLLAVALLLLSRRTLQSRFVAPLRDLVDGAVEISRGNLAHRIRAEGVDEVRQLAATFGEMTRRLAESQRVLVESERQAALGALVPVVAHNIRNPLASIRATAQIMDDPVTGEELIESRTAIIDTVDRLERWVTSLLSYLVPLQPRRRACRVAEVVDGALAPLAQKIERKSLRLVRDDGGAGTCRCRRTPTCWSRPSTPSWGTRWRPRRSAPACVWASRAVNTRSAWRSTTKEPESTSCRRRGSSHPDRATRAEATDSASRSHSRSVRLTAAPSTSGGATAVEPARPSPFRSPPPLPGGKGWRIRRALREACRSTPGPAS